MNRLRLIYTFQWDLIVKFVIPKFHCELAGEGLEYSWGASKRIYCRNPLGAKRSVVNFEKLVKKSLGKVTKSISCRFSAKARDYMTGNVHKYMQQKDNAKQKIQ